MRKLLIATHNLGKLEEMQGYLKELSFEVVSMDDTDIPKEWRVEEVGQTFEGNALIKAIITGKKSGMLTIADDSGVSIDALNGEPGVKSARYAKGTDKQRYEVVLEKMKDVPDEKRTAKFTSVIAVYDPMSDQVTVTYGECLGRITREPKGERGFGYDPIFFADEIGKTYAEATLEEKMRIDHRGRAMQKMYEILKRFP
ncbi:MAG: RdgB/HAM1 family non-canonical purine NTP pyrophosphatase [Candidatus Kaiserbacteria bacterium]|nr:RdgB/HAM1 family non-canonical purine NTP pyrophosphatase [Candidatus Kaiserbacteria bacterium]